MTLCNERSFHDSFHETSNLLQMKRTVKPTQFLPYLFSPGQIIKTRFQCDEGVDKSHFEILEVQIHYRVRLAPSSPSNTWMIGKEEVLPESYFDRAADSNLLEVSVLC